jgi:hypothetical protein
MADPFLLSHSCAPFQFTFAGPLTPVSIRDQMIRGKMFADRAIEQRIISRDRDLLVTGAGAGGVTAAIRAAQLGVKTTLVEASPQAFGRQKNCTTRWVDPTQYDWPADHWDRAKYPWTPPAVPLPWSAQLSAPIAAVWERELRRALQRYKNLQFLPQSTVVSIAYRPATRDLAIALNTRSGAITRVYGAALHCIGFGTERASSGTYSSFQFWDSDPLELPQLGLPSKPQSVLICGGGDGALQDFLRITTGTKSAGDLFRTLPSKAREMVTPAIYSAEDQAQRAGTWCEKHHEHAVFSRLHQVHNYQVQQVLTDPATAPGVSQALDGALQHAQGLEILLAHPCDHFSRCYALNRFLTLLVLAHAQANAIPIVRVPWTGVGSVIGIGHTCANNPGYCHGKQHKVQLQSAPTCKTGPTGTPIVTSDFQVVILRLGVNAPAPFANNSPLLITRQILPYHASQ